MYWKNKGWMKSLSLVSSGLEYIQSLSNGVWVRRDVCSLGSVPFCRGRTFSPRERLLCVYSAVLSGDRFRDVRDRGFQDPGSAVCCGGFCSATLACRKRSSNTWVSLPGHGFSSSWRCEPCCGYMLILSRTRGRLRFTLCKQEGFASFLRSQLNSLFALWVLFLYSLSKRINNLKNHNKCVIDIHVC